MIQESAYLAMTATTLKMANVWFDLDDAQFTLNYSQLLIVIDKLQKIQG